MKPSNTLPAFQVKADELRATYDSLIRARVFILALTRSPSQPRSTAQTHTPLPCLTSFRHSPSYRLPSHRNRVPTTTKSNRMLVVTRTHRSPCRASCSFSTRCCRILAAAPGIRVHTPVLHKSRVTFQIDSSESLARLPLARSIRIHSPSNVLPSGYVCTCVRKQREKRVVRIGSILAS